MAVSTPTSISVTDATGLILPTMAAEPLGTALRNGNYLYIRHAPQLVSVCPISTWAGTRTHTYIVPILPSADALPYLFAHRLLPAYNGTADVTVEWAATMAGPWTAIYPATATAAMTSGTWHRHEHTTTIPAAARLLRVTYAVGGDCIVGHILAVPNVDVTAVPFVSPWGQTASGFRVFDDALLAGVAGAPVNTEMLDRCRRNAVRVLRDRYQMAFSVVQDSTATARYRSPSPGAGKKMLLGHARMWIPALRGGAKGTLDVRAVASVDGAGATADLVIVQVGKKSLTLAADGTLQSGTIQVTGELNDVRVRVNDNGTDNTSLLACVGLWRPGD